jgi:hypothetical protein
MRPTVEAASPPVEPGEDSALKLLYDEEIEEPGENVDSTEYIKYFMSMRDNCGRSRKAYVESLTGAPRKRVDNEIVRIDKLRKTFFANPTKTELVREHLKRRKLWREEAIGNQQQNLKDLERRRDQFEYEVETGKSPLDQLEPEKNWFDKVFKKSEVQNDSTCSEEQDQEEESRKIEKRNLRRQMFRNEERILNAISKWDRNPQETSTQPTNESEMAKEKMKYNIKAGIMYFHGEGTDKKNEHVQGVFPHQKIPIEVLLKDVENNPLLESSSHEDGPIRYFHLPTNNMAWVEVSLFFSESTDRTNALRSEILGIILFQSPQGQVKEGTSRETARISKLARPDTWWDRTSCSRSTSETTVFDSAKLVKIV